MARAVTIRTPRGAFAALQSRPANGVCERKPAILVPGFTGSKEDFIPVLQPLAAAGRIITAIDMRGQYQSPAAPSGAGYTPDELAADIAAVADAVTSDDDGVHLLGHSFGGLIARHVVLGRTTTVASLALLSSGPGSITGPRRDALLDSLALLAGDSGPSKSSPSTFSQVESDLSRFDTARLRAWSERLWAERGGPQAQADGVAEDIIAFLRKRHLDSSPAGLYVMGKYLLSCPDRTEELAHVEGLPILVVYGENDDAWPPHVQDHMGRQLKAQRICIPEAAHSPAIEAPETTASTLTSFWNNAEEISRRRRRDT
jgi:pimeloyl-ACP methyl ester carboxylesterase